MLDTVLKRVRGLATGLREKASERKRVHAIDPAADAMEFCAAEIDELAAALEAESETLTPEQYAPLHGVSAQSVRNWIRAGELQATRGADGYWHIPKNAVRVHRIGGRADATRAHAALPDVALPHAS